MVNIYPCKYISLNKPTEEQKHSLLFEIFNGSKGHAYL